MARTFTAQEHAKSVRREALAWRETERCYRLLGKAKLEVLARELAENAEQQVASLDLLHALTTKEHLLHVLTTTEEH
jgi:hypothetical protein